jgi:MFS transporter, PHS family, inorganic phosphate transporter
MVLSVGGFIPGFFAAAFIIDRIGRKSVQIRGYVILVVLFYIIGFTWDSLGVKPLFALFCPYNFFSAEYHYVYRSRGTFSYSESGNSTRD